MLLDHDPKQLSKDFSRFNRLGILQDNTNVGDTVSLNKAIVCFKPYNTKSTSRKNILL